MEYNQAVSVINQVKAEIHKEIIGQEKTVDNLLMALLVGGNVLLEGMPGLGKTRLVQTISHVFDMSFRRIQFTPDLMPADITGTNIMVRNEQGSSFKFEAGPIFANVVLADEINRATPKTQSALLEAMQEHTVTVGDLTYALPDPFFVIATQNPIEQEGTYPLPEAQLDRFAMKLLVEYPTKEELAAIVNLTEGFGVQPVQPMVKPETLIEIRQMIQQIPIADPVMGRALDLVMATHADNKYIREGASPRAAQYIVRCAKARAFMLGRLNVAFEDIDAVAVAVLRHRIILSFDAVADGVDADTIIKQLLG
ncbi:MAG: MoxR family ATPase [Eubacterium sp.]|jgi:MoxR-like ATPase|nr:MoxR family ATPase [Eubacterium sp.]MBR1772891.1 MoxR family ATPase [Eubacterium sp.]